MSTSQNGYSVIAPSEAVLWRIPVKAGTKKHFILRPGHTGFVLSHFSLFFHEVVEPLNIQEVWDDWGYANRLVRGSTTVISNHASGTAVDLNATEHPRGVRGTFDKEQVFHITRRLAWMNHDVIRWGGTFRTTVDEMHFEIDAGMDDVTKLAKRLQNTPRGRRIIRVNPHYHK